MGVLLMCCLELMCGNPETLVCAYSAATILINNHCLYIVISLLLNIFLIRSTVVFHFGRLPFWSSSILVVFHFSHLPFWSSSILVPGRLGWVLGPLSCSLTDVFFCSLS